MPPPEWIDMHEIVFAPHRPAGAPKRVSAAGKTTKPGPAGGNKRKGGSGGAVEPAPKKTKGQQKAPDVPFNTRWDFDRSTAKGIGNAPNAWRYESLKLKRANVAFETGTQFKYTKTCGAWLEFAVVAPVILSHPRRVGGKTDLAYCLAVMQRSSSSPSKWEEHPMLEAVWVSGPPYLAPRLTQCELGQVLKMLRGKASKLSLPVNPTNGLVPRPHKSKPLDACLKGKGGWSGERAPEESDGLVFGGENTLALLGDVGKVPLGAATGDAAAGSSKRPGRGSTSGVVPVGPVTEVKMANERGPVLQQMQSSFDYSSATSMLMTTLSYEASYLAELKERKKKDAQRKVWISPQDAS